MRSLAVAPMFLIAACAPTQVVTGTVRPQVPVASVVLYATPPSTFEQIALLSASSRTLFGTGGQKTVDKLIRRLSSQAAKLGANGIILDDLSDEQSLSLGTGVGSDSYTHNADISLGLGALISVYKKTGNARAVYVPRE
jgi:murein endopeptidase